MHISHSSEDVSLEDILKEASEYIISKTGLNEEDATIQAYERREKAKFKERIDAHNRYKKFKNLYNKKYSLDPPPLDQGVS